MEKEKLVHYVPADMVDRLKKLLVRLWETRNPASAQLGAILEDAEPEVRSLNETLFDVSARERNAAIREKDRNWTREREKLREEAGRALEELRAAATARLEKAGVSFACEKAELNEALGRAQKESEDLYSENRRMKGRLEEQEAELKRRLFEAKAEYDKESGRRIQEAVEQITGHLLLALKAAEQKFSDASAEAFRAKEENDRLRDALAARTRQLEESIAQQAGELEVKEHDLASLRATARELETRISELTEAHQAELKEKLRAKETELNKAAAERLELERAEAEAQAGRQEGLLARAREDLGKAKKELEDLAAERRRLADSLAGRENETEKRLFEARSEFERESGRRVQEAVEEVTGRLLASLKASEKKGEEAAEGTALAKDESARLKASLDERERQYEERSRWQEEESAAKDRRLAAEHEKVKELENRILGLNEEHHAELMEKLREKEAEFRSRLEEFDRERGAYLKLIDGLKGRFAEEKEVWEAERERIRTKSGEKFAELEAGLRAAQAARTAELEREYAARQSAELVAKERDLAAERGKVKELEKQFIAWSEEHYAELAARLREKEAELRSRREEAGKERDAYLKSLNELKARFEGEKAALEEEFERAKAGSAEKYAGLEAALKASLAARAEELEREHAARRAALAAELREREAELNREAAERLEAGRAAREARSGRRESLLAETAADLKKARAALEAEAREQAEAFKAREKNWALEKERYESELALCAVSTKSFIADQALKTKADLAKWKEALEEEYKARLEEQLRARDLLLITEKGRQAQEFMEKYAALEARLESLLPGPGPGAREAPGAKKKREA
ncbi:MAG: hypothetical protein HY550_06900 [Elusimicrobia bacterium]|nr:hypothetical protein [Elusimicrobiota bacterium]